MREVEEALGFAGFGDLAEVDGEGAAAVFGDELGEGVADHVFERCGRGSRLRRR